MTEPCKVFGKPTSYGPDFFRAVLFLVGADIFFDKFNVHILYMNMYVYK